MGGIAKRLNQQASRQTKVRVATRGGGSAVTFTATANINVRVSMLNGRERERADRDESISLVKIFMLANETVKIHDHLVIGSRTFEIISIERPSRGDHLEIIGEEIDRGS